MLAADPDARRTIANTRGRSNDLVEPLLGNSKELAAVHIVVVLGAPLVEDPGD